MKNECEHFTIIIDKDIMWKYFQYYKIQHPKARTFSFANKIVEKLYNKDGTHQLTKTKKQKTKSRSRNFSEIEKEDMKYSILSLNDLLPIDSMGYSSIKKKWGELGLFLAKINKLENKNYKSIMVEYVIFSETKAKKDIDNLIGASKILNDQLFVGSGMVEDDNYTILNPFLGSAQYSKEYPHTEIRVSVFDDIINKYDIEDYYDKIQIHINNFKGTNNKK